MDFLKYKFMQTGRSLVVFVFCDCWVDRICVDQYIIDIIF